MHRKREICIIGPGAIGLSLAILFAADHDVTLLVREESLESYRNLPLKLSGHLVREIPPGEIRIISKKELTELSPESIFLVAVKAYDLDSALSSLTPLLSRSTPVVLLQNGLGIFMQAAESVKRAAPMIRALPSFGVKKSESNTVILSGALTLSVSAMKEDEAIAKEISLLFESIGTVVSAPVNVAHAEWEKALLNLAVNPLACILNAPNGVVLSSPKRIQLTKDLLRETRQIAAAEGFDISEISDDEIFKKIENCASNTNSWLNDLREGKSTECNSILGRALRIADSHGVPAPYSQTLAAVMNRLEAERILAEKA